MKTSFSEATQYQSNNSGSGDFKVKFFQIQPNEQAIVRILVDSEEDLCAYGFHEIPTPDGKFKRVNCIRSLREDVNKCPLCAAETKFEQQIYIHMLQYYPDGHIEAKTWGRKPPVGNKGTSVIDQIRKALENYGPLSDYVSSITRTGTGLDTAYSININLPDKVYPAANFPLDRTLFEGYSEEGTIIKNWTADEMNVYLTTGAIPENKAVTPAFNSATAQPVYQPAYQPITEPAVGTNLPFNMTPTTPVVPVPNDVPFQPTVQSMAPTSPAFQQPISGAVQQQPVMDRPVRRYN